MFRALAALFIRSLREDVRSRTTYIVRSALVGLVLLFLWIAHSSARWSGAVGREFFSNVLWIDLFVLSIVGLGYFASSITEEKESDMLGLLRMTDLSALAILLGKSTSRLIGAFLLIAAQLPFMLVAVTMGGLGITQVLAGFVCLLGYAFLLANLGLLTSVLCRRTSTSSALSGGIIAVFLFGPFLLYDFSWQFSTDAVERTMWLWRRATPFAWTADVLRTGFAGPIFDWRLGVAVVAGSLCFLAAWLLFERFADSTDSAAELTPSVKSVVEGSTGTTAQAQTASYRTFVRRAEIPAIRWKDYYYIAGGDAAVVIKSIVTFLILVFCLMPLGRVSANNVMACGALMYFFCLALFGLCAAVDAGRMFKREREERTFSSLLGLPISTRKLVMEKTIGCLRTSIPPLAGVGIGCLLFLGAAAFELRELTPLKVRNFFEMGAMACYFLVTTILLPVLIAGMSLQMRWGAFPIGFVTWFFGNIIGATILFAASSRVAPFLLPVVTGAVLWLSVRLMLRRLEAVAAES